MKTFSTKQFSWIKCGVTTIGSAFISDSPFCDLNDKIFSVVSTRTGNIATYRLLREVFNNENELTHWEFAPTNNIGVNTEIHLFND